MDTRKLIELLRATIDPNQRQQAEDQLRQIHKIIGFAPSLLQVIMMSDVDMPVRQAGAIYLKNLITQNWHERDGEPGQPIPFSLHEQDRAMIRDSIVDANVHAPELIRLQLSVCVSNMVKHDFPGRWTQIVDKISIYLQNPDANGWPGALLCLYQLVKNFEYKKPEERGPINEAMNLLLPMIYQLCVRLLPDQSEQSVFLQKQILKIYFALTQYTLPLDLIGKEMFSQWMEIIRVIVDRPVPDQPTQVEEDEMPELPWWKCKKWALHIMYRMFERYGSPGNVITEYNEFAEWYLKTFSAGIIEVLLKILDQYRNRVYISPRVLQQTLNYINQGVCHAYSWKFLKPHMMAIIQDVLFPIMSYTEEDEELWTLDPHEYIRVKFDVFEDFISPVTAAQTLLNSSCRKRKNMLQKTMQLMLQILNSPNSTFNEKDGALHMIGTLADILLKKALYKDQMENMFVQYVFPEFNNVKGHMRARACWVLHFFSEIQFKQEPILAEALRLIINALLTDHDLPVKVEAGIALQSMLNYQVRAQKYIEPQVTQITLELLTIIRETENDDLTSVMQKIVCTYTQQLMPIAVEMCQHLATTFSQVLETDEGSDEKAITAMGLLNTIETLLNVMEEQPDIMVCLEPTVLHVVIHIFQQANIEFYEEALSLVYDLTSKKISPDMWKVLELIYQMFQKNGVDHFVDMMPALHNYVTVDTPAFLSNENYILAMFNMAKTILTGDSGEDAECHAAKLIEVIILQCKGHIDQCIPSLVELMFNRLTCEVKTSELRTMCLQVVIAVLYYNPQLLFSVMEKLPMPTTNESIVSHFIKQWIHDIDCFLGLHDRKMCVLGLVSLISMNPGRPSVVNEVAPRIIPSLILLFNGLKRAYVVRAQELVSEESEEDIDDVEGTPGSKYWKFKNLLFSRPDSKVLSSDEDDIDEEGQAYLEQLSKRAISAGKSAGFNVKANINDTDDDSDTDDEYEPNEETTLESYTTPLDETDCDVDEYIIFKEIMARLQLTEPNWYGTLTAGLTTEQQKSLQEVIVLADQRKAALESKRIEQSGGYAFTQQTVPTSFKFGSASLGP